jgi:hypothetical protein
VASKANLRTRNGNQQSPLYAANYYHNTQLYDYLVAIRKKQSQPQDLRDMIRKYLPVILLDEEDEDEPVRPVKHQVESSSESDDDDSDLDPEIVSKLYNSVVALDERLRHIEGMEFDVPEVDTAVPAEKSLAAITAKLSELASRVVGLEEAEPEDTMNHDEDPEEPPEPEIDEPPEPEIDEPLSLPEEAANQELAACGAMCEFCGCQAVMFCAECGHMLCSMCQGSAEHLEYHFNDD